jgi:predicted O-methyltransferase YrrM
VTNPIDRCHCDLIYGLAVSLKPTRILELGYGEGASARALWAAMIYNGRDCWYVLVDDWRSTQPQFPLSERHPPKTLVALAPRQTQFFTMLEADFYDSMKPESDLYELILSDCDHENAHLYYQDSLRLLKPGGLLIYHDVTNPNHPKLKSIVTQANESGYPTLVFNKSSRPDEECQRGLLVIRKTE